MNKVTESTKPRLLERLASKCAAKLIVFCGTRAARRGDWHEVNHLLAALTIGNTGKPDHCRDCSAKGIPAGHSAHLTHQTCIFHGAPVQEVRDTVEALVRGDLT